MSCEARNLLNYENSIKLPLSEDLDVDYNDVKLNLKYLNKYFQVNKLDETLERHRNEFTTRTEHLQKRQEALHEREIMFKEKLISYEMYIKELVMKRDRSLRRIDDEKNVRINKQIEIDFLKQEIEKIQEEKMKLQEILFRYQPHLQLLTQIVDQTDRYHSIDEIIEKFDMLYASYQDILTIIKTSNEELNDRQRQLLLITEKKINKISLMNNRIHELEQHLIEIQQRIEKIQIEIGRYQQISTEYLTEIGAIKIAIESMFDLVKKYSHRSRKKDLNLNNQCLVKKLNQIDTFLSDLIYYVNYVNNKQKKIIPIEHSINVDQGHISESITTDMDDSNRWRGSCQINQREALIKHERQPFFSYKSRGEDNILYTIQIMNVDKSKPSQTRHSLSSISMILRSKDKKNSMFTASTPKLQRSIDAQPRSSTTRSIRTTFKIPNQQYNNDKMPFSESELTYRNSILTNKK